MIHDPAKSVHETHAEWQARLQRHAQESAARAEREAVLRTLEQHAVYLSTFGTGDADYAAKRAYMLAHGLEYTNGTLGYAPSTVHREAAWEAHGIRGLAQQSRAPGRMFSRSDILAILRADRARYMAGLRIAPVPDCPAEATVVNNLITIFEYLE